MAKHQPANGPKNTRDLSIEEDLKRVSDDNEIEQKWKLFLARHEYAWRYFDFHAKQRTTMFNFFIVFAALLFNAYASLLKEDEFFLSAVVGGLGALITTCFVCLERRNEELVYLAETVLGALEDDVLFRSEFCRDIVYPKRRRWYGKMQGTSQCIRLGIIGRQIRDDSDPNIGKTKYSHGFWLPFIQYSIALMFLFLAVFSFVKCFCDSSSN